MAEKMLARTMSGNGAPSGKGMIFRGLCAWSAFSAERLPDLVTLQAADPGGRLERMRLAYFWAPELLESGRRRR
jgi:hypothetical protein